MVGRKEAADGTAPAARLAQLPHLQRHGPLEQPRRRQRRLVRLHGRTSSPQVVLTL